MGEFEVVELVAGEEASFDLLVLGSGGGPTEDDLSAYWIKPKQQCWADGFVSVDGGASISPACTHHPNNKT